MAAPCGLTDAALAAPLKWILYTPDSELAESAC